MTHRPRKPGAFTLVELLLVIVIASIIMGIGAAAYIGMNKDLAWHSSVTMITSLLHAARNSATTNRMPVSVIIKTDTEPEPEYRQGGRERYVCTEIYATFARRIGGWHFEEPDDPFDASTLIEGALSQKATPVGMDGAQLAAGRYGKAIEFLRWVEGVPVALPQALMIGEETAAGTYSRIPSYDVREGLRVSAWVKPELPPEPEQGVFYYYPVIAKPRQENAARAILDQQPVYSLMLCLDTDANSRVFRLVAGVQTEGGALIEAVTRPMVKPDTWTHVAMMYSGADTGAQGTFVRVFIDDEEILPGRGLDKWLQDGTETATPSATGGIAISALPPMIGADGMDYFHGAIDEVMVDAVTTSERKAPRATVLFQLRNCDTSRPGTYSISFDRSGHLILKPGGLPVIALYSSGSPRATLIGVELTGAIKTWSTNQEYASDQAGEWLGQ